MNDLNGLLEGAMIGNALWLVAEVVLRIVGNRGLLHRYQARAARSGPLATLYPEPWTDRPYGLFRPEDVGA